MSMYCSPPVCQMNQGFEYLWILSSLDFRIDLVRPGSRQNALLTCLLPVWIALHTERFITHGPAVDQGTHEVFMVKIADFVMQVRRSHRHCQDRKSY